MNRPANNEYDPYFQRYLGQVPEGEFGFLFDESTSKVVQFFGSIPNEKHDFSYSIGKWSIKTVLMHLIDTERVFAYRALVTSRGDVSTQLQPFDEDAYAAATDVSTRSMDSLLEEFLAVRRTTALLFEHMTDAESAIIGKGPTHGISARAIAFILIGHVQHHVSVVQERYL
jgi:DinB superfamily